VPPSLEGRIIAQAEGNALFLEELIRAAAEGKTEGVPGTVLAMLQARLGRLPAGARRVLCAASVYGSVFWRGGVAALLGESPAATVDAWLPHLIDEEIIQRHADTRLALEVEYGFRHDLVRDAAYTLLGDKDRVLGHELAAQFLEGACEHDALTLAEHYQRGEAAKKAAKWFHRAAEQALEANELESAHERAQRALDAGAAGAERGQLYGIRAAAAYWQRDDAETRRWAEQALSFLTPGTSDWYQCAAHRLVSSGRLKDWDGVALWLRAVMSAEPSPTAVAARIVCLSRTGFMFMMQGRPAEMKQIAEELAARAAELPESEAAALAQLNHFRSGYALTTGDLAAGIQFMEATIAAFVRAEDLRNALLERSNLACMYIEVGLFEEATRLCRFNVCECERERAPAAGTLSLLILGFALAFVPGERAEAREALEEAARRSAAAQNRRHQGWAHAALARLEYSEGRFLEAEAQARVALERTAEAPTFQAWPLAWLSRALVKQGRAEEGLLCATEALSKMKQFGGFTMDVSVPPLAHIEALLAVGHMEAAREAITRSKRRLLRRAERMTDPSLRASLFKHPENAAILAMAGD
jgi:tetratricopeptide (TPR) repeat protein